MRALTSYSTICVTAALLSGVQAGRLEQDMWWMVNDPAESSTKSKKPSIGEHFAPDFFFDPANEEMPWWDTEDQS